MRWDPDFLEHAPDVEAALAAVGLPVIKCERQTRPPHHVRTDFARKLSIDEKELANRTKAALKAGKFDAAKELKWFDRKRQPTTIATPINNELVALGLIEPDEELKEGSIRASRQQVPDAEDAFRQLGFPIERVERNTTGPLRLYTTFTRDLSDDERAEFNAQRAVIRQRLLDGKPLVEPAQKPPPQFPAPALIDDAPGVPVKRQTELDPHEAKALRTIGNEVIRQAWADAFSGKGSAKDASDARSFLTQPYGDWAKARELWCAIADYCPDWLRDQARKHAA